MRREVTNQYSGGSPQLYYEAIIKITVTVKYIHFC